MTMSTIFNILTYLGYCITLSNEVLPQISLDAFSRNIHSSGHFLCPQLSSQFDANVVIIPQTSGLWCLRQFLVTFLHASFFRCFVCIAKIVQTFATRQHTSTATNQKRMLWTGYTGNNEVMILSFFDSGVSLRLGVFISSTDESNKRDTCLLADRRPYRTWGMHFSCHIYPVS
jgi:hypothetical protein